MLIIPLCSNAAATETGSIQESDYSTTIVQMGDISVEVPVYTQRVLVANNEDHIALTRMIHIPQNTEECLANNSKIVSEIKTYGAPTTRGTMNFGDYGYMTFTSTLNYGYRYNQGFRYIKMISYKIEREIYTSAPYNTFGKPQVRVVQVGETFEDGYDSADLLSQYYDQTMNFDTLYTVPSDWAYVYQVGPTNGLHYRIQIDYATSFGATDYTLEFSHPAI